MATIAQDVLDFYALMQEAGITVWIDGGWSVDALLGRELRPHKDLDIAIQWQDVPRLCELLVERGYQQVREDSQWNFVLADEAGREIDVHAFIYDEAGNIVEGILYPAESLTGSGMIAGQVVKCIAPEHMVAFLAPWIHKWPEKYVQAVAALCQEFGIALPNEYSAFVEKRSAI